MSNSKYLLKKMLTEKIYYSHKLIKYPYSVLYQCFEFFMNAVSELL